MTKKRPSISVRIERETKRELDRRDDLNLSGLVRGLLENYLRVGDAVEVALEKRLQDQEDKLRDLQRQKADIESRIDRTEREIDDLRDKIKERRESVPEEVVEFAERIKSGRFNGDLDADNPAVINQADKSGLTVEKFIRKVEERL